MSGRPTEDDLRGRPPLPPGLADFADIKAPGLVDFADIKAPGLADREHLYDGGGALAGQTVELPD